MGDQSKDHEEPEERDEPDEGDKEEEVSLLLLHQSETVEYVYGGFTVMDAMIQDMADHFHVDMSHHRLPPCPDWFYWPREQHVSVAANDDDGVDEDHDV